MLCHWDDVEAEAIERGELRGERLRLGRAAGAERAGLSRYRIPPGARAMPVHVHADEEELFYVLDGEGLSWQDGRTWRVRAGDCLVHLAGGAPHTILAGDETLDVLAFATGSPTGITWLPRAQAWWLGPRWLPHDGPSPFAREVQAGPLEVPAPGDGPPPHSASPARVEAEPWGEGDVDVVEHGLARAAGAKRAGLNLLTVAPRALSAPPHCHSAEEELFVVLDGDGTLLLGDEQHPVRRGHVVARPPGTGVPHAFRAGDGGLVLLVYGDHDPNDICFYPRSQKVALRGVKARFRITQAEYWEGET